MENQLFSAMQGWQCPICKRVYSPFTHMCTYCGKKEVKTTTSANTEELLSEQKDNFSNQTTNQTTSK